MARVHLVDASPYIFRAFFALPDSLTTATGQPVNAVYGFAGFLLKLLDDESVTHLGLAFDRSLTTSFRNALYPEYKAQRSLPPPELEAQQELCRRMGQALGAAVFDDERYEADDLIATLCGPLAAAGHDVVIVTSDKDLAQLVTDRVSLFDFARDERLGPAEVEEKLGVEPALVPDLLGLAGDPVDNIPGVPRVGPKTAVALLRALGGLDAVYGRLDAVAELPLRGARGLRARLEEHRDMALLSRRLATVAADAPVAASLADLRYHGADRGGVDALFEELGFEGLKERIREWRGSS